MKIVSINIEIDRHHDTVNALIEKEKPDVICFQELLEENFEYFKKTYGKDGIFLPAAYLSHPTQGGPQNRRFGLGIFSNSIINSGYSYYVGNESHIAVSFEEYFRNGLPQEEHGLLWIDSVFEGNVYRIATTHLPATHLGQVTEFQLNTIDSMCTVLDTIGEFILIGDMNAPRGFEAWSRLAARYTDNIPPEYMTSLDQNLHRVKGLMYVVDGLFTTKKYTAHNVKLVDGVSDHMAIVGEVTKVENQ